ncbi:hypothetical protein F750_4745 [Streptomyces sp. PAMC 26508]|nr:hypothetical protein F750_4745 [Streptomyces sp. PAMC 26508]
MRTGGAAAPDTVGGPPVPPLYYAPVSALLLKIWVCGEPLK